MIWAAIADARVTRILIQHRESPAFRGQSFGKAGVYETLSGRFYGELDPKDPHNSIITDIQFAPRNSRGMVQYSGTCALSKLVDMSKASGVLFYSVLNRGNGTTTGSEDGHISRVSGWQGDLLPRTNFQTIDVPIAKNPDGSPLTGPVMTRLINLPSNTHTVELAPLQYVGLTYQKPLSPDTSKASLTRRTPWESPATMVPAKEWAFADCREKPFPGTPDPGRICVKSGFDSSSEYTLVYTATDPLVLGIGYAATRDLNSFFRYDESAANPVAKQ